MTVPHVPARLSASLSKSSNPLTYASESQLLDLCLLIEDLGVDADRADSLHRLRILLAARVR